MMCDVLQCEHNEDGFCCTDCFVDEGGMCVTMRLLPPSEWPEVEDEH